MKENVNQYGMMIILIIFAIFAGAITINAAFSYPSAIGSLVPGGNPSQGAQAIAFYGCGSCHRIPGIAGANGTVGPPLIGLRDRSFIAGRLPNNADNLILWIQHPQSVSPGVDMPEMGVPEPSARDIAAYLYSIR